MRAALLATLLTLQMLACTARAAPDAAAMFSDCASGLPRSDLQGRALDADFWQAGPLLLVFWSPDCPYCRRHNERLSRLLRELPQARVLGVAVDGSAAEVRSAMLREGIDFPLIIDGAGGCALRPQLSPRRLVPMSCWLGEAPTQPRCIPGEMAEDDLRALLNASLRRVPAATPDSAAPARRR